MRNVTWHDYASFLTIYGIFFFDLPLYRVTPFLLYMANFFLLYMAKVDRQRPCLQQGNLLFSSHYSDQTPCVSTLPRDKPTDWYCSWSEDTLLRRCSHLELDTSNKENVLKKEKEIGNGRTMSPRSPCSKSMCESVVWKESAMRREHNSSQSCLTLQEPENTCLLIQSQDEGYWAQGDGLGTCWVHALLTTLHHCAGSPEAAKQAAHSIIPLMWAGMCSSRIAVLSCSATKSVRLWVQIKDFA
jgi:hypothetical protein